MWYVVPFEAKHLFQMDFQESQKWILPYLEYNKVKTLENEWASTVMLDGKPMLCGGPLPDGAHRAILWSVISKEVGHSVFRIIHRYVKNYLDGLPFRRLEAAVDVDFKAGHRWMTALGFKIDAPVMRAFQVDGRDCALYAKVRD